MEIILNNTAEGVSLQEIIAWAITTIYTLSYPAPSFKSSSLSQLSANAEVTRPKRNPHQPLL